MLLHAIEKQLGHSARRAPVLLAVYDLLCADFPTHRAIRMLAGRLVGHPVMWVLGVQPLGRTSIGAIAHDHRRE